MSGRGAGGLHPAAPGRSTRPRGHHRLAGRRADIDGPRVLPALGGTGRASTAGRARRSSTPIQTNGTRLDDAWGAFFKEHNFLVGLSVDGPRELHDAYRVTRADRAASTQVLRGWEMLRRHEVDVEHPVHACTPPTPDHPLEVYRFFRDELGAQFMQFIPIVERVTPQTRALAEAGWTADGRAGSGRCTRSRGTASRSRSVKPRQYGRFLIDIFDGVGAPRRGAGLRADVRRDAGQLRRPAQPVRLRPDVRQCAGPGAQRRSLRVRPLRRAGLPARATSWRRP